MFYVIYNSATKQYLNDEEEPSAFAHAAQFGSAAGAQTALDSLLDAPRTLRVVGPCVEGETP